MILIGANLVLYAILEELPHHLKAKTWLESMLNSDEPVA